MSKALNREVVKATTMLNFITHNKYTKEEKKERQLAAVQLVRGYLDKIEEHLNKR